MKQAISRRALPKEAGSAMPLLHEGIVPNLLRDKLTRDRKGGAASRLRDACGPAQMIAAVPCAVVVPFVVFLRGRYRDLQDRA